MSVKQQFLETYDKEHATTMRVLRAYPTDQLELRPHPKSKSARELAWLFAQECGLGTRVWNDELVKGVPSNKPPAPPEDWNELLEKLEAASQSYRDLIANAPDDALSEKVHFFVAPKTMGEYTRIDWIWFLLSDQIHHRGQFSVYLRMAGGKVPSIYGPSGDEPWF